MLYLNDQQLTAVPMTVPGLLKETAEFAISAKQTFYVPSPDRLNPFLENLKGLREGSGSSGKTGLAKLEPAYDAFRERVTGVTVSGVQKSKAEWWITLTVTTAGGKSIDLPLFTSVKRHLLHSFAVNQNTPRPIREDNKDSTGSTRARNSIVRDAALFEELFLRYAEGYKNALLANQMVFLFNPHCMNPKPGDLQAPSGFVHDQRIPFETDTMSMPQDMYTHRPNGIHCYPSGFPTNGKDDASLSTEVLQLTDEQYYALVLLMLFIHESDQYDQYRHPFPTTKTFSSHDAQAKVQYEKRLKEYETTLVKAAATIRTDLGIPPTKAFPDVLAALEDRVTKSVPLQKTRAAIGTANEALHGLLSELGKVAAIPNAPVIQTPASLVLDHIQFLPKTTIAWAVYFKPNEVDGLITEIKEAATKNKGKVKPPEGQIADAQKSYLSKIKNAPDNKVVETLRKSYEEMVSHYKTETLAMPVL
jgi:hypothetical protein